MKSARCGHRVLQNAEIHFHPQHSEHALVDARLRERAPRVRIGVHLILGLIGENDEMMVETAQRVAALRPDEVKLHLLYVLKNTKLGEIYANGGYKPLEFQQYVSLAVRVLEQLPPETVIGRLTGDGAPEALLAPLWSLKKRNILNEIDKKFYKDNTWQGKKNCKNL